MKGVLFFHFFIQFGPSKFQVFRAFYLLYNFVWVSFYQASCLLLMMATLQMTLFILFFFFFPSNSKPKQMGSTETEWIELIDTVLGGLPWKQGSFFAIIYCSSDFSSLCGEVNNNKYMSLRLRMMLWGRKQLLDNLFGSHFPNHTPQEQNLR